MCVIITTLVHIQLVMPAALAFNMAAVCAGEVWRLMTAFCYCGGFTPAFLLQLHVIGSCETQHQPAPSVARHSLTPLPSGQMAPCSSASRAVTRAPALIPTCGALSTLPRWPTGSTARHLLALQGVWRGSAGGGSDHDSRQPQPTSVSHLSQPPRPATSASPPRHKIRHRGPALSLVGAARPAELQQPFYMTAAAFFCVGATAHIPWKLVAPHASGPPPDRHPPAPLGGTICAITCHPATH